MRAEVNDKREEITEKFIPTEQSDNRSYLNPIPLDHSDYYS